MKFVKLTLFLAAISLLSFIGARLRTEYTGYLDYRSTWMDDKCLNGKEQSPIDINPNTALANNLGTALVKSTYKTLSNAKFEFKKGYAYEISGLLPDQGSLFSRKNGVNYKWNLNNIHFHIPSEHTIGNHRYDLEFHFIHAKDEQYLKQNNIVDKDPKRKALVMGVFFSVEGEEKEEDSRKRFRKEDEETLDFSDFLSHFDLRTLLNVRKPFYNYEGGLTTPDCAEIIEWVVFKDPVTISKEDFTKFTNWVLKTYPIGNARNIYPVNHRKIYKKNMNK